MGDLIDRQVAIQRIKDCYCSECDNAICRACEYAYCINILKEQPAIEPEVQRGQIDEDKPITNADRIRKMSDEELAEFIVSHAKIVSDVCQFYNVTKVSRIIEWLRKEFE